MGKKSWRVSLDEGTLHARIPRENQKRFSLLPSPPSCIRSSSIFRIITIHVTVTSIVKKKYLDRRDPRKIVIVAAAVKSR